MSYRGGRSPVTGNLWYSGPAPYEKTKPRRAWLEEEPMASVNKVILVGNLGKDPDMKYTQNGTAVCTFSLATTEQWTDAQGQRQEKTEWHRITVWKKQAENCGKYLRKGSSAYIEGKLQTRSWDDQQGQKRYSTDIIADTVKFLGSAGGSVRSDELPPPVDIPSDMPF